jgi:hypothetical protein
MAKSGMMTNWVTFAMAAYMALDYDACLDTIKSIINFDNENAATLKPFEKNALRLLEVRCLGKLGKHNDAWKKLKNKTV